jgi:hypothetical protein
MYMVGFMMHDHRCDALVLNCESFRALRTQLSEPNKFTAVQALESEFFTCAESSIPE